MGFGNPLSLKNVFDIEIDAIEASVRKNWSRLLNLKNPKSALDLFGPLYVNDPQNFVFEIGERMMIKLISKHVRVIVDGNGENTGLHHFKFVNNSSTQNVDIKINSSRTHFFFNKLLAAADQNATRSKEGFRYDADVQLYASYLRMIIGPLGYETLQKNLESALPSLPSTNRYIRASHIHITEGVLRNSELLSYLNERKLPLVVSLSEDATRIVGTVQYDSRTNQLIGFVLPINKKNGMPIPFSYSARNADEIYKHFSNENSVSSYLNVIMAQPVAKNAAPFCLLIYGSDNKYTGNDVSKRWRFIRDQLADSGIETLTISSDSDPRYNAAMKELSRLGNKSEEFGKWFSFGKMSLHTTIYVQDSTHIATKLRNFLLKTFYNAKKLPFGKFFIDVNHLHYLLQTYSKDKHQLTQTILNPKDKQNFASVLKMCDSKVIELLKTVNGSDATVLYLEMLKNIVFAFMDPDLTPQQRIKNIWYALFIIRIWRHYIESHKNYTLKDNFMSANCYSCIELNAHSLVLLMIKLKETNRSDLFLPQLFESQPCESMFRLFRSFTSTYSTVANCSVKEALSRISKIQLQNEIMRTTSPQYIYPRLNKKTTADNKSSPDLPTKEEIIELIKQCQHDAICKARELGLIPKRPLNDYTCKIIAYDTEKYLGKTQLKKTLNTSENCCLLPDLSNIQLKDHTEKLKDLAVDCTSQYVEILRDDGEKIIVKKTSLCWALRSDHHKLSSDRLERVKYQACMNHASAKRKRD